MCNRWLAYLFYFALVFKQIEALTHIDINVHADFYIFLQNSKSYQKKNKNFHEMDPLVEAN